MTSIKKIALFPLFNLAQAIELAYLWPRLKSGTSQHPASAKWPTVYSFFAVFGASAQFRHSTIATDLVFFPVQ
jgi:hypothetical protein